MNPRPNAKVFMWQILGNGAVMFENPDFNLVAKQFRDLHRWPWFVPEQWRIEGGYVAMPEDEILRLYPKVRSMTAPPEVTPVMVVSEKVAEAIRNFANGVPDEDDTCIN